MPDSLLSLSLSLQLNFEVQFKALLLRRLDRERKRRALGRGGGNRLAKRRRERMVLSQPIWGQAEEKTWAGFQGKSPVG